MAISEEEYQKIKENLLNVHAVSARKFGQYDHHPNNTYGVAASASISALISLEGYMDEQRAMKKNAPVTPEQKPQ